MGAHLSRDYRLPVIPFNSSPPTPRTPPQTPPFASYAPREYRKIIRIRHTCVSASPARLHDFVWRGARASGRLQDFSSYSSLTPPSAKVLLFSHLRCALSQLDHTCFYLARCSQALLQRHHTSCVTPAHPAPVHLVSMGHPLVLNTSMAS